jgi:hypothetical protein
VVPARELLVALIAVVVASTGARAAYAGEPLKPDPNPVATVGGLAPDARPGSAQPRARATRATAKSEVTRAVAPSPPPTTPSATSRAGTPRVGPARAQQPRTPTRRASRTPSRGRRKAAGGHEAGATLTLLPKFRIPPVAGRPGGGVELTTSRPPAKAPLLAAAAALAAVVLVSGSILALTGGQPVGGEF